MPGRGVGVKGESRLWRVRQSHAPMLFATRRVYHCLCRPTKPCSVRNTLLHPRLRTRHCRPRPPLGAYALPFGRYLQKDGDDGDERSDSKPQKKCERKVCKEFQEKLERREEKVMTERQALTDLIVKKTEELKNTEERMAEVERINNIAEERAKGIKDEIQQQKEEMERMEQQQVVVKQENIEMGHKIMILELELQKQHFEARQAQAEMIKALWYVTLRGSGRISTDGGGGWGGSRSRVVVIRNIARDT